MSEAPDTSARPADKVGRVLYRLAAALAILGSAVVGVMAIMIAVNVIGRAVFATSISGIVDLIELGTSTAVFAVLPYCQLMRENVVVDFIMSKTPTRAKTACDAFGSLLYLALGVVLTWRMILGGFDLYKYNETFTTIGFPRWLSFPYATVCMILLVVVTVYTVARSVRETRAGRYFDPTLESADPKMQGVD